MGGAAGRQEDILGVLGADYHEKRKSLLSHRYRLQRRTDEVQRAIEAYGPREIRRLVDVGTADAAMLDMLAARLQGPIDMVG